MKIGGIQKVSLVDYPGKVAAAIFTIGCNMRCGYCHNPELVLPEQYADAIPEQQILNFLASRTDRLQAVVISGGEPTMHADLPEFIDKVRSLGYAIKLDTNGTNPDMLESLLASKRVDFVAMDIKGSLSKYQSIVDRPIDTQAIRRSITLIKESGVDHEFRTTVVKSQISYDDFDEIGKLIQGSPRFALQKFVPRKTLNPGFAYETTYSDDEFVELQSKMEQYVKTCVVH